MRADLLALNSQDPHLRALDADFRHLLATWFDVGFLRRARLTWDSPASLLEKIITYEAVHEIRSWQDLHHRLDGDRRCYAFFHPALPDEPLIFLQVALVEGLAGQIAPLLDETGPSCRPSAPTPPLLLDHQYLVRPARHQLRQLPDQAGGRRPRPGPAQPQAVRDAVADAGLRAWLEDEPPGAWLAHRQERALLAAVPGAGSMRCARRSELVAGSSRHAMLEEPLVRAAARYLTVRGPDGLPIDPVARFHLGNGARIERINWLADRAPRRLAQSAGLMVNYLYDDRRSNGITRRSPAAS